jgi:16S rRNA (guanine966-N2)-methyltransferase
MISGVKAQKTINLTFKMKLSFHSCMRITGGLASNIILKTPTGSTTRPATDRLRESIFSSLGEKVLEAHVLDIFAGTGAYALEALSRGATAATCIEKARSASLCIAENWKNVSKSAALEPHRLQTFTADALTWQAAPAEQFNLIFIDPPYPIWPEVALKLLPRVAPWLAPHGLISIEHLNGLMPTLPENWSVIKTFGKGHKSPVATLCEIKI